ncbi:relaxase/mobilization nuclease domain-containing protein [Pseudolactococcus yaeyamensis]
MVYTKHFNVHTTKNLHQVKDYVENADKTLVNASNSNSHLDNIFPYIANSDKTMSKQLVSGHLIADVYDAANEMLMTKKFSKLKKGTDIELLDESGKVGFRQKDFDKTDGRGGSVLAHHLIQSFSPEDHLTPEEIHEIGRKTILELTGGDYEFVIATHTDKEHIHNHIVFNSTNSLTGKAFRWQKGTKRKFEQISDKHADYAGAKIIEHEKSTFKNHTTYYQYHREKNFKQQIKSRVDFLLANSKDEHDFILKSRALNLNIDFSGKFAKYKLLDEPQVRPTRSRSIAKLKQYDGRYDRQGIVARLKENDVVPGLDEIKNLYDQQKATIENDFEINLHLKDWQVAKVTAHGIYVEVDYGLGNEGLIFVHNKYLEKNDDGSFDMFIKEKDYFYFMNDRNSQSNKYLMGKTLANQLTKYNGTVPIQKPKELRQIDDLVDALNFLAENNVSDGTQFDTLALKFDETVSKINDQLDEADKKILLLNQSHKLLLASVSEQEASLFPEFTKEDFENKLLALGVDPNTDVSNLEKEIEALTIERTLISEKLESVSQDLIFYQDIRHTVEKSEASEREKGVKNER